MAQRQLLACLALLAGCGGRAARAPNPSRTAVSGESPGAPRIFAPGVISTAAPEFGLALSPQGTTAYFNRTTPDRSRIMALQSRLVSGRWQAAVPVPFADSAYRDLDLFLAPGGARIFFSSNRPLTGVDPKSDLDTWYVDRQGAGWGAPIHLTGPVNTAAQDVFVSITKTGTLYFASDRAGNSDVYRAVPTEGGYSDVQRLPDVINTSGSETNPLVAPDESFLVFVAERSGGLGAGDLYVSRRRDGEWTPARNLGAPVNSTYADFAPSLSPDGRYLFFTSERPGIVTGSVTGRRPGDIYRVQLGAIEALRW